MTNATLPQPVRRHGRRLPLAALLALAAGVVQAQTAVPAPAPAPAPAPMPDSAAAAEWRAWADSLRQQAAEWKTWAAQMQLAQRAAGTPAPAAPPAPPAPPEIQLLTGQGRSFLGVQVVEIDTDRARALSLKEERGVEITSVEADSPAEKAGLRKGDVVLDYQGQRVEGTEQFIRLVRETPAGRQVKLTVHRGGTTQTIAATVGTRKGGVMRSFSFEMPRPEIWIPDLPRAYTGWRSQMFGVEAESLDGQLADFFGVKQGVLVRSVVKGSAAEKAGLKAGDVIIKVDDKTIDSPRELSSVIRTGREKKSLPVVVVRDRKEVALTATFEEASAPAPQRTRRVTQREEYRF